GASLERQPARVEAHTFADERHGRVALLAPAIPVHDDELAFALAALAHAEQGAHAELLHLGFSENIDFDAELGEKRFRTTCESLGMQDVRRLVDQIARGDDATGNTLEPRPAVLRIRYGVGGD